eukprot:CAMPEP_0117435214 /NCGR_PEP_ID=MMETSP0759-20121206/361_1 /TAXON_ID=63605 /ORGANISM="Percolomonas cosmopolitus, Strain WS" /LENGTH=275 /DNA_ID=CAMNT_0005226745 /DNA_START=80 /DNA_END=904 /DNA_ORIENTATION=-
MTGKVDNTNGNDTSAMGNDAIMIPLNSGAAQIGAASMFLTQAQQTLKRSSSTLDEGSSGTLGNGTGDSAQDIELQIILTNNQDLIYSANLSFDDICQHRQDTFSHSDMEWMDYFALLLDPTSTLQVTCDDPDVWSISFKGDATNLSTKSSIVGTDGQDQKVANHIKFEYQVCRLVDEEMRRDAMQYLLFALVGMIETQHLKVKQLNHKNAQLQEKLKHRPALQEMSGDHAPFPHQQNVTSSLALDTLKLKRKRSHPLSTLRPFKRAKKARGAIIS